jgi:hypothetical protein
MLARLLRLGSRVSALGVVSLSILILVPTPASAHERRQVGAYTFTVGFSTEPAFSHIPNGPEVTITKGPNEEPVAEGVDLEVEIIFGDESTTLAVEPAFVVDVFGEPGNYDASIFPTRPGTYTFRFFGTVEGTEIDESFTSGPETFNDINDPAEFAFPVDDPNNAELAERIEQESAEMTETQDEVNGARTLGLIGLIVGGVGLVVGITVGVLFLRRRS